MSWHKTFTDIDELALMCKLHNCTHTSEPGFSVQKAVHDGIFSADRLLTYQKLKNEAKYKNMSFKQIETVKLNEMFSDAGGMKNARRFAKSKNRKR